MSYICERTIGQAGCSFFAGKSYNRKRCKIIENIDRHIEECRRALQ